MKVMPLIWVAFRPYQWQIAIMGLLGILGGLFAGIGVSAIIPLFAFIIGDQTNQEGDISHYLINFLKFIHLSPTVYSLLLVIVLVFIFRTILLFVASFVRGRIVYDYRVRTMSELFSGILSARWQYLVRQKLGYIQNTIMLDIEKSADILQAISQLLLSLVSVLVFLGFAMFISLRITFLTIIGGIVLLLIFKPLLTKAKKLGALFAFQGKVVTHYIAEHIIGLKSVKTLGVENRVLDKGMRSFKYWKGLEFKSALLGFLNRGSLEPLSVIFIAYIFAFSYKTPGFSLQVFAATVFFIQRTFVYFEGIQASLHTINNNVPHIGHILEFEQELKKEAESNPGKNRFSFSKDLTFHDVSFSYLPETPVLSRINLHLKKGEMVGLIGSSGSGKTSIADLLLRLFEPTEGKITLDGVLAKEFALIEWRRQVGYVSQDIFLLNESVENNIKFYNEIISDEEMHEAAKKANAYEFIQKLPQGFGTVVGDRGMMLSGGQRQRIVLARILVRRPQILVLDEATSALDDESEILIQKAIHNLRGNVTVLIIAHRLSTVVDVDRLLVLDKGKILEEGAPRELLQNPDSYFYKMYHLKEL